MEIVKMTSPCHLEMRGGELSRLWEGGGRNRKVKKKEVYRRGGRVSSKAKQSGGAILI